MAHTHENILVGAAEVFIGPVGQDGLSDLGEGPAFDSLNESDDWRHVGLTQGGVEFAYAPDFGEVEVDQWLDVAKMFKQRQSVTVNTTFAEATLENLLFAWGQPLNTWSGSGAGFEPGEDENGVAIDYGSDDVLRISAGSLGDRPEERGFAFVGQAPGTVEENNERVYHLYRALNVESSSHSLSRSENTAIPVAVRCLPTNAAGGADYGVIRDRTLTT